MQLIGHENAVKLGVIEENGSYVRSVSGRCMDDIILYMSKGNYSPERDQQLVAMASAIAAWVQHNDHDTLYQIQRLARLKEVLDKVSTDLSGELVEHFNSTINKLIYTQEEGIPA